MADALNYAKQYSQALAQNFPYVLYFGELYATPNNQLYKITGANTIEIPVIETSGRVDGDRDTITGFQRRASNKWETKVLRNHRTWDTLIHPMDVVQTNQVMTIQNATKVYNQEQKFPEMDAYTISAIHSLKTALGVGHEDDTTVLTIENILSTIDKIMETMDEARVPKVGRIMYCTPAVETLIKNAKEIQRTIDLKDGAKALTREISRIDELTIKGVPSDLMQTVYDFTEGWKKGASAKQINFCIIHPVAVLTPVNYTFAQVGEPSALTKGKWVYFEESFEDVFILNQKAKAIAFNVKGE